MSGTDQPALVVRDLTVRYGGITAVSSVDLDVAARSITGLIGPNGAGKSSLFNACAGSVRAASGRVELFGRDISRMGPARRARVGLGRTFQRIQLFRTMTVAENVAMGQESAFAWRRPWSLVVASRGERRTARRVVEDVLELCELTRVQNRVAGSLSTGEQRMVELARVLASPARLLLLDEPSSGLGSDERRHFAGILRHATESLERSVLVVEHDMDLVAALCSRVYVLNFGRLIFAGAMSDALDSDVVQQSYLGTTSAGASADDVATPARTERLGA